MEPRFKMHTLQAYKEGSNKASTVSAWLFPFLLHAPSQPPAGCPVLVRFGVEDSSLHDTMLTLSLERFENSLPWFRKNRRPTSRQIVQICSKIHLSRGATKNATESKHPNPCSQQIAGPGNHSYCIILHIYDYMMCMVSFRCYCCYVWGTKNFLLGQWHSVHQLEKVWKVHRPLLRQHLFIRKSFSTRAKARHGQVQ